MKSNDLLEQPLRIDDRLNLDGLGYDEGSYAIIVLNLTKAMRTAWSETYKLESEGNEELPSISDEWLASGFTQEDAGLIKRLSLVPYLLKYLCLKIGEHTRIYMEDDLGKIEVIRQITCDDERIIDIAINESLERGRSQYFGTQRNFRDGRISRLKSASP